MHILISRRHPVAQHLTKLIQDNRLSVKVLSEYACVTEDYVRYLMNFAHKEEQVWLLVENIRSYQSSKKTKPYIWVNISPEVNSFLREQENISAACQEIYKSWRKDENRS